MTASRLNPNMWDGEERSGGYIARNTKPTSANSPDFRGRIYLIGVGWFWLSGWTKNSKGGEILALRAQEMTDEQAEKFCKPKPQPTRQGGATHHRPPHQPHGQNGADSIDGEIPF